MAEQTTKPATARAKRPRKGAAAAPPDRVEPALPRGRTAPLDEKQQHELFHRGVALFNGVRYWHAHEAWETLWRAAPDEERDFYQGLIMVAAGLLHLQRRNVRGARNKLAEGVARLRPYMPTHRGIFVDEVVVRAERILAELNDGRLPYLIPPVIRFVEPDDPHADRA
jgi:hypothetical protein